jgi:hypothetical protein
LKIIDNGMNVYAATVAFVLVAVSQHQQTTTAAERNQMREK